MPRFRVGTSPPISAALTAKNSPWFRPRGYQHFDRAVGPWFVKSCGDACFVARHSWLPLIHYVKKTKRYKSKTKKTIYKDRHIMFASHCDACILSKYAFDLNKMLDDHYEKTVLQSNVIAYRKLGQANYDFSATARRFASAQGVCVVLCFDITGFFDSLDHSILKERLKRISGVSELSSDWFKVFRQVTRYRQVNLDDILSNETLSKRVIKRSLEPTASMSEIKSAGIIIGTNPNKFGIPQGTPISASLSNLYMIDVDHVMTSLCNECEGMYQRYSDDIMIICSERQESKIVDTFKNVIKEHKLELHDSKMERVLFGGKNEDKFQYLGFLASKGSVSIRDSSLARQWRKARRAIKDTKLKGQAAILRGEVEVISTKRLRKRFWPTGSRNFGKYARKASAAFGSREILNQTLRIERFVDAAIREMQKKDL